MDSEHPRWPAGSPGGIGGEFAPKDTSGAVSALHEAISQDAADAASAAANAGRQVAANPMFHDDSIDSDPIGGLLVPAVGAATAVELIGAEATTATASRAGATEEVTAGATDSASALGDGTAAHSLNESQLQNLERFNSKLPANAGSTNVSALPNGNMVFQADVPAENIPNSFARYEKVVDSDGNTVQYIKTTYAPDGSVVHAKVKFP